MQILQSNSGGLLWVFAIMTVSVTFVTRLKKAILTFPAKENMPHRTQKCQILKQVKSFQKGMPPLVPVVPEYDLWLAWVPNTDAKVKTGPTFFSDRSLA